MIDGNGKPTEPENVVDSQRTTPIAVRLLQEIQSKSRQASSLTEEQRRICLRYLMSLDKYENREMAEILDIGEATLYRDKRKIKQDVLFDTIMIDEADFARDIIECADNIFIRLTLQKKHRDAWTVKKECAELLQSMGYIKKIQPDLNIKGQISLKEVFEGASAEQFKPEELDPGFSADGLDRLVEGS